MESRRNAMDTIISFKIVMHCPVWQIVLILAARLPLQYRANGILSLQQGACCLSRLIACACDFSSMRLVTLQVNDKRPSLPSHPHLPLPCFPRDGPESTERQRAFHCIKLASSSNGTAGDNANSRHGAGQDPGRQRRETRRVVTRGEEDGQYEEILAVSASLKMVHFARVPLRGIEVREYLAWPYVGNHERANSEYPTLRYLHCPRCTRAPPALRFTIQHAFCSMSLVAIVGYGQRCRYTRAQPGLCCALFLDAELIRN